MCIGFDPNGRSTPAPPSNSSSSNSSLPGGPTNACFVYTSPPQVGPSEDDGSDEPAPSGTPSKRSLVDHTAHDSTTHSGRRLVPRASIPLLGGCVLPTPVAFPGYPGAKTIRDADTSNNTRRRALYSGIPRWFIATRTCTTFDYTKVDTTGLNSVIGSVDHVCK
jgi:hypothetical protein